MSERELMSGTHDCGGDAAAYALGALEPQEAEAFRAHLQGCAVCRDELEALGGVVRTLPMAAQQYEAPRDLRRRVMQQVRAEPVATGDARGRPWALWLGRTRNRVIAVAGAAVVAAAGVVTGIELTAGAVATVITAQVSEISGSAQLRIADGHAELIVRHLTPPGRGRVYEIWLQSGAAAPVPASVLFDVNTAGDAQVGIPRRMRGVSAVLVTPEPYGGTTTPTHRPVIIARLD